MNGSETASESTGSVAKIVVFWTFVVVIMCVALALGSQVIDHQLDAEASTKVVGTIR